MYAIEIENLTKRFKDKQVLQGLNMHVKEGAIYGFIGENGSGKSTTEKLICGLLIPNGGTIKLFGKDYKDKNVRNSLGCLIESPGCYPNLSVWNNMYLQATNLNIKNPKEEVAKVLKLVRMEGAASNKFKNCSLGMKQRIGIAISLLSSPKLLVLDEPINGLDVDGMRIMREVLIDITKNYNSTVLISSHILSELEKIATDYGIIRQGKMLKEMTALELESNCPNYIKIKTLENDKAKYLLFSKYNKVEESDGCLRIYDNVNSEEIIKYLYDNNVIVSEVTKEKINLEEYYINLMSERS